MSTGPLGPPNPTTEIVPDFHPMHRRAELLAKIAEISRDRDEWKQQHENLLAIYQAGDARKGLEAAIRAAKLALFVIRKQGVMPNSSWETGFNSDLKVAEDALATLL